MGEDEIVRPEVEAAKCEVLEAEGRRGRLQCVVRSEMEAGGVEENTGTMFKFFGLGWTLVLGRLRRV